MHCICCCSCQCPSKCEPREWKFNYHLHKVWRKIFVVWGNNVLEGSFKMLTGPLSRTHASFNNFFFMGWSARLTREIKNTLHYVWFLIHHCNQYGFRIYIYSYFLRFIKKIEYHHLILSLRYFVNLSNTKWIQSKLFPLNTNYDHYANIKGAAHINNSKLKHKAYEDIDTIITMSSI